MGEMEEIANYSEFYVDKAGEIVFITAYVPEEREKVIDMFEDFPSDRRCCGLPPIGRKAIASWIDDVAERGYAFIAKVGDRVAGYIVAVPENSEAEFAIFVHQDYADKGIGGELIRFAERFLAMKGIKKLKAVSESTNRTAVDIYLHLGFEITGRDGYYLNFEKELGNPR